MYLRFLIIIRYEMKGKCFLFTFALLLAGCTASYDHKGKTPVVQVGKDFLYREDLEAVMPVNLGKEDSVRFAEEYIKNWLEDALLYDKAEGNISDNDRINKLIESYRRALIVHAYQDALVKQELADSVTDEEVERYYEQNKGLFVAEAPLVQGLYLKVPLHAPHLNQVRGWYKKNSQEAIDRLEKYSVANAVSYEYFYDHWKTVKSIQSRMPLPDAAETDPAYFVKNKNIEVKDTAYCYFLHVENVVQKNEQLPLEHARTGIKETLINLKRVEFINKVKEDLYREATEDKSIIYY